MSLRESLYRLRRVAESKGLHAETYVPDVRAVLDSDARLRDEVRELRRFVESMALDPDANMEPDVYDYSAIITGLARDCLNTVAALAPKRKARR